MGGSWANIWSTATVACFQKVRPTFDRPALCLSRHPFPLLDLKDLGDLKGERRGGFVVAITSTPATAHNHSPPPRIAHRPMVLLALIVLIVLLIFGSLQSIPVQLLAIATPSSPLHTLLRRRRSRNSNHSHNHNLNHRPRQFNLSKLLHRCKSNRRHSQPLRQPNQQELLCHRRLS